MLMICTSYSNVAYAAGELSLVLLWLKRLKEESHLTPSFCSLNLCCLERFLRAEITCILNSRLRDLLNCKDCPRGKFTRITSSLFAHVVLSAWRPLWIFQVALTGYFIALQSRQVKINKNDLCSLLYLQSLKQGLARWAHNNLSYSSYHFLSLLMDSPPKSSLISSSPYLS